MPPYNSLSLNLVAVADSFMDEVDAYLHYQLNFVQSGIECVYFTEFEVSDKSGDDLFTEQNPQFRECRIGGSRADLRKLLGV